MQIKKNRIVYSNKYIGKLCHVMFHIKLAETFFLNIVNLFKPADNWMQITEFNHILILKNLE